MHVCISSYVNVELELHSNYAEVVISKETVPSFMFLAKKVFALSLSLSVWYAVRVHGDDL